jgi:Rod binding domain-containing protein
MSQVFAGGNKEAREKTALQELEHLFLFTMLREMRKTTQPAKSVDNSSERQTYDEMLDDALSGEMARSGQVGLAKTIEAQLRAAEKGIPARRPDQVKAAARYADKQEEFRILRK